MSTRLTRPTMYGPHQVRKTASPTNQLSAADACAGNSTVAQRRAEAAAPFQVKALSASSDAAVGAPCAGPEGTEPAQHAVLPRQTGGRRPRDPPPGSFPGRSETALAGWHPSRILPGTPRPSGVPRGLFSSYSQPCVARFHGIEIDITAYRGRAGAVPRSQKIPGLRAWHHLPGGQPASQGRVAPGQ